MKCENNILKDWFSIRVPEIVDHLKSWSDKGVHVRALHQWPGVKNISDILTLGKAVAQDLGPGSEWQCAPVELLMPRHEWLASRAFKRSLPD